MPSPLLLDWDPVKATAIATNSLKEAAEVHNISYDAVRQEAHRRQWPVAQRLRRQAKHAQEQAQQSIAKSNPASVTAVTKPSIAMVNCLDRRKHKSRLNLSKYVLNASYVAAKSRSPLKIAHDVKAAASVMSHIWPEQHVPGVSLQILNVSGEMS